IRKANEKHWKVDGIAAAKAGDHERAAELLGRYSDRHPSDIEALQAFIASRELAELPNGQHLAETANALKILQSQGAGKMEDQRHLLELYVKMGKAPEALDLANT